jgi:hypothetical protein
MKQTERNFWLDGGLFLTLLSITFTGFLLWLHIPHQTTSVFLGLNRQVWIAAHLGSGLAGACCTVIHIIWHRKWLKAIRKCSIASLPSKLKANRVTNRIVWVIYLMVAVLGVLDWIVPAFENKANIFGRLHVALGIAWLIGITVHLVLHKKWITFAFRRWLKPTCPPGRVEWFVR